VFYAPAVRPRSTAAALSALALLTTSSARADLPADVERLRQHWAAKGARVEHLEPMFLERGHAKSIQLSANKGETADGDCLTVAFIGVRTADFRVSLDAQAEGDEESEQKRLFLPFGHPPLDADTRSRSVEGVSLLSRCGAERRELERVTIEMNSARATVEAVVARSARPLGALSEILPERVPGPTAPRGSPRGAIEPGPLAERRARAERRSRAEGADTVITAAMRASSEGNGEFDLKLGEGCHRLELMAEVPRLVPRRATDLDAEARIMGSNKLLARDRAEVPDARLDFCLGESSRVSVPFTGASGAVEVALSAARWGLSPYLPVHWGARARAGFAAALSRRHAPTPKSAPILESLGVQGVTRVSLETEPGHCYLAAMGVIRGEVRGLRLLARIGEEIPHDEVVENAEGAAIAFCVEQEQRAQLEIDARGNGPWWALAVWNMGTLEL